MYAPDHFIMRWLNLGFMLFCINTDDQMINWWKNGIDDEEIKFHLNKNIEWHRMTLSFYYFGTHLVSYYFNLKLFYKV
jgi:hypothetical protein